MDRNQLNNLYYEILKFEDSTLCQELNQAINDYYAYLLAKELVTVSKDKKIIMHNSLVKYDDAAKGRLESISDNKLVDYFSVMLEKFHNLRNNYSMYDVSEEDVRTVNENKSAVNLYYAMPKLYRCCEEYLELISTAKDPEYYSYITELFNKTKMSFDTVLKHCWDLIKQTSISNFFRTLKDEKGETNFLEVINLISRYKSDEEFAKKIDIYLLSLEKYNHAVSPINEKISEMEQALYYIERLRFNEELLRDYKRKNVEINAKENQKKSVIEENDKKIISRIINRPSVEKTLSKLDDEISKAKQDKENIAASLKELGLEKLVNIVDDPSLATETETKIMLLINSRKPLTEVETFAQKELKTLNESKEQLNKLLSKANPNVNRLINNNFEEVKALKNIDDETFLATYIFGFANSFFKSRIEVVSSLVMMSPETAKEIENGVDDMLNKTISSYDQEFNEILNKKENSHSKI